MQGPSRRENSAPLRQVRQKGTTTAANSNICVVLAQLVWQQFDERRRDMRLTLKYKVVHGLVAELGESVVFNTQRLDKPCQPKYPYKHLLPDTDTTKHFTNNTISVWTALPPTLNWVAGLPEAPKRPPVP